MYVLIQYPAGVVVEGVVLANGKNRMRVAVPGFTDTIELKRSGPNWFGAGHQSVQLDFVMSLNRETQRDWTVPLQNLQAVRFAGSN